MKVGVDGKKGCGEGGWGGGWEKNPEIFEKRSEIKK